MSLYSPFNFAVESLRKLFKNRVKDGLPAFLGDGTGRCEVEDRKGFYYYRFQIGGVVSIARATTAAFPVFDGADIFVAYNRAGEVEIVEANFARMDETGFDTRVLNPLHQQSKWVYLWQITIGLCAAVATSATNSYLVSIKKHLTYFNNVLTYFETGEEADKLDLEPYKPAVADQHCYAVVWKDAYNNVAEVTTSTAQSLFMPLDITDVNEAVAGRPPDAQIYKAFVLTNPGNSLRQSITEIDTRQFLNTPQVHGFPSPVAYRERIHPDRQVLFAGSLVVTGSLEVLGSLVGLPTGGDDGSGSGSGLTSPLTTKGDLWGYSTTDARVPVGTNGFPLVPDSAQALGVKYSSTVTLTQINDTGGSEAVTVGTGEVAINESGVNRDTRIEGENNANLVVVDASADALGIGTATPSVKTILDVSSTSRLARPVPTMTTTNRNAITSPVDAGALWNSDLKRFDFAYNSLYGVFGANAPICDVRMSTGSTNPYADGAAQTKIYVHPVKSGVVWLFQENNPYSVLPYYAADQGGRFQFANSVSTSCDIFSSPGATILTPNSDIKIGMAVTGTGIPANTVVIDIDSTGTTVFFNNSTTTTTTTTLTFALASDTNYDVFAYPYYPTSTAANVELVAWTNATTRATALTTTFGVYTKNGDRTRRYIGTIRTNSSGQFEDQVLKRFIWNNDHRDTRQLWRYDDTNTWAYTSGTIRQANGSTANQVEVVVGLADVSLIELTVIGIASTAGATIGVGRDSTTAYSAGGGGKQLGMLLAVNAPTTAEFAEPVPLGYHFYSWNEAGIAGNTFTGDAGVATRQSGMKGTIWA